MTADRRYVARAGRKGYAVLLPSMGAASAASLIEGFACADECVSNSGSRCADSSMMRSSVLVSFSGMRLLSVVLALALWLLTTEARGEEIIFLQDGRTIRAEKTEIIGDRVRIEKPAETIEIPRSDVLSIHAVTSPTASPTSPPPADVYRDMSQQMTDKVRGEIPAPGATRGK